MKVTGIYSFFPGSHSFYVFMQILKFPTYLPELRRLAETPHCKPLGRWTVVFNIIPGNVKEVTEAGLFDLVHTYVGASLAKQGILLQITKAVEEVKVEATWERISSTQN